MSVTSRFLRFSSSRISFIVTVAMTTMKDSATIMAASYDGGDSHDDSKDYSDSEDSLDKENESVWDDIKGAWRQHMLAIFVAVIAASYLHFSSNGTTSLERFNAYAHEWMTGMPHPHVHVYKRTANISFCSHTAGDHDPHPASSLTRFDFRVPRDLIHVMEAHFKADLLEIDDYDNVSNTTMAPDSPEYKCLRERTHHSSDAPSIKGFAWGYQLPSFKRMFPDTDLKTPASLSFTGFSAKFVNMGPTPVLLHWDGRGGTKESAQLVGELAPFQALGTATTPGQSFYVSPIIDSKHALQRWTLTADTALVVYDPMETTNEKQLTERETLLRDMQLLNSEYARDYKVATKRTWLAHFPRPHPMHPMRPASYLGQVHRVNVDDGESEKEYQLNVVSIAPRVFTIANFLSDKECDHLVHRAQQQGLEASTVVSGGSSANHLRSSLTRSSFNAWIAREDSNATDTIYRRAASLLGMDESLFRHRSREHEDIASYNSLAESIQVVRYQQDQEYTAHHDFTHPYSFNRHQPTRFATLLMYLNEPQMGGKTVFPRAINPSNHDGLSVTPKRGMAVLFYNLLPDGNMDDLSQHASIPVVQGEKWLANLWVWDPIID